jgi:hypothetical protein
LNYFSAQFRLEAWLLIGFGLQSVFPIASGMAGQTISISQEQSARWLEVRQVKGTVTIQQSGRPTRSAQVRDRLQKIGEQIKTGQQSEAVLAIDNGIAIVRLTENTTLQVKTLRNTPQGGQVTLLSVPQGLARLQVRPLNNPTSRLQIQTPAGVAGVRGTEFGVGVSPQGRMTVATNEGGVATKAQAQTVLVTGGFYSLVPLGQPPTPPKASTGDVRLTLLQLERTGEQIGNQIQARIVGSVEAANSVFLNGTEVELDLQGRFDQVTSLDSSNRLQVLVRSPFGLEQIYNLNVGVSPWQLSQ